MSVIRPPASDSRTAGYRCTNASASVIIRPAAYSVTRSAVANSRRIPRSMTSLTPNPRTLGLDQQLPPHHVDPPQPLRGEHRLHRRDLEHRIHDIRDGRPIDVAHPRILTLRVRGFKLRIDHDFRVEHTSDTAG